MISLKELDCSGTGLDQRPKARSRGVSHIHQSQSTPTRIFLCTRIE